MEMEFPPEYPMAPPFVRVVRPRFRFLTGEIYNRLAEGSFHGPFNDI